MIFVLFLFFGTNGRGALIGCDVTNYEGLGIKGMGAGTCYDVTNCRIFCRKERGAGTDCDARHSERGKKTRWTKEDVGRQHRGMDRPGVRQVPEGSGEQGKMEKTVAKSSVVPQ